MTTPHYLHIQYTFRIDPRTKKTKNKNKQQKQKQKQKLKQKWFCAFLFVIGLWVTMSLCLNVMSPSHAYGIPTDIKILLMIRHSRPIPLHVFMLPLLVLDTPCEEKIRPPKKKKKKHQQQQQQTKQNKKQQNKTKQQKKTKKNKTETKNNNNKQTNKNKKAKINTEKNNKQETKT